MRRPATASPGTGRQTATTSASPAAPHGSSSSTWTRMAAYPLTGNCPASTTGGTCSPRSASGQGSRGRPPTWSATPSGGWHLYYAAPEGREIRNSASLLGPLIDVRAGGGYIIGADSIVGGKRYELLDASDPEPLPPLDLPAPGPSASLPRPAGTAGSPGSKSGCRDSSPPSAPARHGDRNGPLYWASRRAAEMIAAGEISREEAEEPLVAAVLEAGLRGGEAEARGRSPRRCAEPVCEPGAKPGRGPTARRSHQARQAGHRGSQRAGAIRALREAINTGKIPSTYVSSGRVVAVEKVSGTPGAAAGDEDSPLPVTASEVRAPELARAARRAHLHLPDPHPQDRERERRDLRGGDHPADRGPERRARAQGVAGPAAPARHRRRPGAAAGRHPAAAARL